MAAIGAALAKADPAGRRRLRGQRAPLVRRLRALDAAVRAASAQIPAGASARSSPRTTRSATTPRRYGLRVVGTVIPSLSTQAQASAGDLAKLVDTIRREHVQRDLRRELGQRERRGRDRAGDRRARRAAAVGGLARPGGLQRRDLRGLDPGEHRRDRRGPDRRREDVLVPALILDAPYVQRAIAELAAARRAGRRARLLDRAAPARLLHARGRHGDVPGPGRRRAVGRRAAADGARGRARLRGRASSGSRAGAGWTPAPRPGCCSSPRSPPGVVLASDVYESGAGVDQLLFGSLIGLERARRRG